MGGERSGPGRLSRGPAARSSSGGSTTRPWEPVLLLAVATIPLAAGIAILRYRLYEIDRIVNRAVVYGAVTALLVGAYFGIVLGLQEVFSSFGGGSDLAIADLDARRRRALPAPARPRAACRRPALLPPPLRRPAHARGLRRPAPRRGRPRSRSAASSPPSCDERCSPSHVSLWLRETRRCSDEPADSDRVSPGRFARIAIALAFAVARRSSSSTARRLASAVSGRHGSAMPCSASLVLAFPTVGALIASRRPQNPIGWIFVGLGSLFAVAAFASEYASYALLTEPGSLPAGETMAWLGSWLFVAPLILTGTLLFLLFPDGRLLSRRWRPVRLGRASAQSCSALLAGDVQPWPTLEDFESRDRTRMQPEGSRRRARTASRTSRSSSCSSGVVVSAASLVLRFRRRARARAPAAQVGRGAAGLLGVAFASGPVAVLVRRRRRPIWASQTAPGRDRDDPGRGRNRDPALPPLRHRPHRQPGRRLRRASRRCSSAPTSGSCSASRRSSRRSPAAPTSPSPSRRSSSRRSSSRCARACSAPSTGASTAAATTPSARSRRSARGCARGRPRGAPRRAHQRRATNDAARARLALASSRRNGFRNARDGPRVQRTVRCRRLSADLAPSAAARRSRRRSRTTRPMLCRRARRPTPAEALGRRDRAQRPARRVPPERRRRRRGRDSSSSTRRRSTRCEPPGVALVVPLVSGASWSARSTSGRGSPTSSTRPTTSGCSTRSRPRPRRRCRSAELVREQATEAASRERIEQELEVAQLIQQNFLPRELPELAGWQSRPTTSRPARSAATSTTSSSSTDGRSASSSAT